jgi:hypothetical protein
MAKQIPSLCSSARASFPSCQHKRHRCSRVLWARVLVHPGLDAVLPRRQRPPGASSICFATGAPSGVANPAVTRQHLAASTQQQRSRVQVPPCRAPPPSPPPAKPSPIYRSPSPSPFDISKVACPFRPCQKPIGRHFKEQLTAGRPPSHLPWTPRRTSAAPGRPRTTP